MELLWRNGLYDLVLKSSDPGDQAEELTRQGHTGDKGLYTDLFKQEVWRQRPSRVEILRVTVVEPHRLVCIRSLWIDPSPVSFCQLPAVHP